MPEHKHDISITTEGNHTHTIYYGANDSWDSHVQGNL